MVNELTFLQNCSHIAKCKNIKAKYLFRFILTLSLDHRYCLFMDRNKPRNIDEKILFNDHILCLQVSLCFIGLGENTRCF